jgi:adhesin/invasin
MATYSKVILSGQTNSFPTLVTTPTLSPTAGSVANVQAPVGTAITATITNATTTGSLITYTATNTFVAGQVVTITSIVGFTNANLTNAIITSATGSSFTVTSAVATQSYTSGGTATVAVSNTTATVTAAALSANTNTVTYTTSAAHGFIVGQTITITGLSGTNSALANLANIVINTVPSTTTFTAAVPFSTSAIALTAQTGTATSYNALYSYVYVTNAQVFAATQLVNVSGLTTAGYNVGATPILSVSTLSAPTSTTYAFGFTVSVPSTLTTALSAQAGTAVSLPAIGTFIHNNTGGGLDEVWLYATNLTNAAVTLSLIVGGPQTFGAAATFPQALATPSQEMTITIPGNSGLTLINPGLILSPNTSTNNSAIYAYASQANAIAISGYVNRIV